MESRKTYPIRNEILSEVYESGKKSMSEIVKVLSEKYGVSERAIYNSTRDLSQAGFIEIEGKGIRGSPTELKITERGRIYTEQIISKFGEGYQGEVSPDDLCNIPGDIVAEAFRCGVLRRIGKKIFPASLFHPKCARDRRVLRYLD